MPYKRYPPAEESDMRKKRYMGHHTICEKWREVWRIGMKLSTINVENLSQEALSIVAYDIMMKAREGMVLGKRMHEKLKGYKIYRDSGENNEEGIEGPEEKEGD